MAEGKPSSFWKELRRRHVVRALSIYAVAAWVVVQVADVFFPALLLPDWSVTVVAVAAIAGFPLTAVVAWVYDWRSGGLKRTAAAEAPEGRPGAEGAGHPVVAVLPFETLGDANPTLTEGLHGDILTGLSAVSGLDVISRSSVIRYRDPDTPVEEIRRALGAGWMLRGEVQQVGDAVRVHARLVDIQRDRQVWANAFQRKLTASGLFEIQDEITDRIVTATKARLGVRDRAGDEEAGTEDLEAYRLQVQGRALLGPRTEPSMRRAVGYFERALELDPGLAEAHFALANLAHANRRNPDAMRRLSRSVDLRPSYADAHNLMSWIQRLDGRPEDSLRSAVRAVELDPLGSAPLSNLALGRLIDGDAGEALETARHMRSVAPDYTTGPFLEALVLYHEGRHAEAKPLLEGLAVAWADQAPRALLALVEAALDDEEAARSRLEDIQAAGDAFSAALVRASLGDVAAAVDRLDDIRDWTYWGTLSLRYFFPGVLGPVRSDPRWPAILRRIGRSWGNPDEGGRRDPGR